MAVETSGCPDILNNDWAASRSQSMQRPILLTIKIPTSNHKNPSN